MTIKNRDSMNRGSPVSHLSTLDPTQDWVVRLQQLTDLLVLCPADIASRCDLAALLERLDQHEEALANWSAVLVSDPNNLKAWEGQARCRRQAGRPLQSNM